jgi:hypothetical protein
MKLELKVITSDVYFSQTGREIDWGENDSTKISCNQAEQIDTILATEASIFLLRRTEGGIGALVSSMDIVRRQFIDKYERDYEPYIEYNDFD